MSRYYDDDDEYRSRRSSSRTRRDSRGPSQDGYPDAYMSPAGSHSGSRLQYDEDYYRASTSNPDFNRGDSSLQAPSSNHRHHSQPSDDDAVVRRRRSSRSLDGGELATTRSPKDKTKHAIDGAFSTSGTGIGVGVIGAIVGGLAAREATEAAARTRDRRHGDGRSSHDHDRAALISTLVGAAVGGLGANAIEKHIEQKRDGRRRRDSQGGDRARDFDSDDSDDESRGSRTSQRSSRRSASNRERGLVVSRSPSPGRSDNYSSYERKSSSRQSDDGYR